MHIILTILARGRVCLEPTAIWVAMHLREPSCWAVLPNTRQRHYAKGRGGATLSNDPGLLAMLAARGVDATMAIKVDIRYTFFHCTYSIALGDLI